MENALTVFDLKKRYDNGVEALKGISFQVKAGDFMALLGPNGAGKSTTIGIISSLVNKTSGKVEIFGKDIDVEFGNAKQEIGIVPQEFNFNQFEKVEDILLSQGGYFGIDRRTAAKSSEKYLKLLGLWGKRRDASRMLSGGMKRRLMTARALIHEPRLLILDEPTAGVDIELRRSMWEFLKELNSQGTTIILTTHYLEEAENLCRSVAIINHGEIVEDTTVKDLLARLDVQTFVLDLNKDLNAAPVVEGVGIRLVDSHLLEVDVKQGQNLNHIFKALDSQGIDVSGMRNKANRLEELFINLVEKGRQ